MKAIKLVLLSLIVSSVFSCSSGRKNLDARLDDLSKKSLPQVQNSANSKGKTSSPDTAKKDESYTITNINLVKAKNLFDTTYITIEPANALSLIRKITFDEKEGRAVGSKIAVFGDYTYYIDTSENKIYLRLPQTDCIVQIKGENDTLLGCFKYEHENQTLKPVSSSMTNIPWHVKLAGSFEAATVEQANYDSISGASGSVSIHKNSNVTVFVTNATNPVDSDWIEISKSGLSAKGTVKIEPSCSMKGLFDKNSSSITLAGTPNAVGEHKISLELEINGKKIESNPLPFRIYSNNEPLSNCLKESNFKNEQKDNSKIWDMEPWIIPRFGEYNETITVPTTLKRWFGSHKSGTYGILGYAIPENTATQQTLIIEADTDLKLINMMVLSSVNIIVKKGARLNLQDSSIHGTITVEDGGTFQMNYNNHEKKFLTGAQINGQLILNNGAKIENSLIYSNTNYVPNGTRARTNENPVVVVKGGEAQITGQVYIRGDEAGTYCKAGQPAMHIENGASVNINHNAVLGLYSGGKTPLTTLAGVALILDGNAEVKGDGTLMAVAGISSKSTAEDDRYAVSGTGTIRVKKALLKGSSVYNTFNTSKKKTANKPYEHTIKIIDTIGIASEGDVKKVGNSFETDFPEYWADVTKIPTYNIDNIGNKPILSYKN